MPIYDVVNEMAFPGRGNGCSVCYPEPTCGVKIRVVKSDFKNECCGYKFGRDKKGCPRVGIGIPRCIRSLTGVVAMCSGSGRSTTNRGGSSMGITVRYTAISILTGRKRD